MADFKIGDKVRIVRMIEEYNGKTGKIIRDGGKKEIKKWTRKIGEDFETVGWQKQWFVEIDDTNKQILVPEVNLEKIS